MKAMIDTNIIIDVLTERDPFFADSKRVLELCESKVICGFVTASAVTDIFYIVRRHTHDTGIAYRCLGYMLDIVKVLPVTNENIISAFIARAKDFEDRLLAECAAVNGCECIITRNTADFDGFGVRLCTPQEIAEKFK